MHMYLWIYVCRYKGAFIYIYICIMYTYTRTWASVNFSGELTGPGSLRTDSQYCREPTKTKLYTTLFPSLLPGDSHVVPFWAVYYNP